MSISRWAFCAENVGISTTWYLLVSSGNIIGLNILSPQKIHSFSEKSCLFNICRSKASRMPFGIRDRGSTSWEKMWISVLLLASSSRWIQAMLEGPSFLRTSRLFSGTSSKLVLPLRSYESSIPLRSALFAISHRPCAMVVPDFELICEIMLVAEGFMNARTLARKFITLYTLCKELLSKQVWGFSTTHTPSKTESSLTSLLSKRWQCNFFFFFFVMKD